VTALFLVRAEVADPRDREGFDRWYQEEHLPQAAEVLSAVRAWRGWSEGDPSIHYAFYELPDLQPVPVIVDALKALVADFDRVWGTRVTRTREIIDTKQLSPRPGLHVVERVSPSVLGKC
jgi:hypothetical protein